VNGEVLRSKEEFIKHYQAKYNGFPVLPIWILTETMSLGALSMFYKGMMNDDKALIAQELNIHYKCLSSWLHMLTYVRNICAHHSRLWNRELAIKAEHKPSERYWLPPFTPRNDRLFYVLLVLRNLLSHSNNHTNWKFNCEKLLMPIADNRRWQVAMGMPDNWIAHPLWK
ncbi:MAG: Abi family protein, partial [Gammaproteobacteria bacterium]